MARGQLMRFFEDLAVGEKFTFGALIVDPQEAEDFALRYDPASMPQIGGYARGIHRGARISLWMAVALSWRLLADFAATSPVEETTFSGPRDLTFGWWAVSAEDRLRIEVEVTELLEPSAAMPEHGLARARVSLITSGPAGFGSWGDDDQEIVDDIALTYSATLKARRRERVSIYHGIN